MAKSKNAIQKIDDALACLESIENSVRSGDEVHSQDTLSVRQALEEAQAILDAKSVGRGEGPVITKDEEGVIVCVTWQEDHEIVEVLAESCGYPAIKAREKQALEAIQNLIGAFDNPIVRRKVGTEFSQEAIAEGRRYLEEHTPEEGVEPMVEVD